MAKKRTASTRTQKPAAPEPAEEVPAVLNETPAEPESWSMPMPSRGQPVVFYYRCTVSEKNADIGFVATVGKTSIGISYRNQGYDECYHKDDPRLKANPELKNDIGGVWDFTKEKLQNDARLSAIEKRLENLEG